MRWEEVTIMDQRVRFISEYLEGYFSMGGVFIFHGKDNISRLLLLSNINIGISPF